MNILIYVTTLLMLLAILTYSRLENFRSSGGFQTGFINRIGLEENTILSKHAESWYGKLKPNSKAANENNADSTAGSRLSVHLLIKQEKREKQQEAYQQTRALLKQLIHELYNKESFYTEMAQKQPNFVEAILNEIQAAALEVEKKQNITKATGLLNLKFNDEELHMAFVKMMHGLPVQATETPKPEATKSFVVQLVDVEKTDTDDELLEGIEATETHAPTGYVSLLDFITVRPTTKVRVFLAAQPLLLAIYQEPGVVENIMERRQELYKTLKDTPKSETKKVQEELSKAFEQEFALKGHSEEYKAILDFSITKTNPRSYK